MAIRKLTLSLFLIVLQISTAVFAKDFELKVLPQAKKPTFDLREAAGTSTYFDYMRSTLGKEMLKQAPKAKSGSTNEDVLKSGGGISVVLSENNYNIHINYPSRATGGRSYGWTSGQVGDWSDAMYLDNLADIVTQKGAAGNADIKKFYTVLVEMLGSCTSDSDDASIEDLRPQTQRVAANFLAIYTAEQYRSMVPVEPHKNWDDALLQTTLLGAFHGAQKKLTKFYLGKFTDRSKKQGSGVYDRTRMRPGPNAASAPEKDAELKDYWQFSHKVDSKQSGINITRKDFQLMGEAITEYEREKGSSNLKQIEKIVGTSDNVINALSKHFSEGHAAVSDTQKLAGLVAAFMIEVRTDANDITKWLAE